jgi:potassium-dependent mechanosensitive channel
MNWVLIQIEKFVTMLVRLLETPMFDLGDTPISISMVARVLLYVFIVFLMSRLIGQTLGRTILARMGFDRGTRESISSVIYYCLATLGFILVLHTQGINLSSLAVIAGVVGLGVGIGLQNLSSNFISGLTLLIERPVQVGDFIEVDKLLGTVEQISFRSTTIRTQDGVFVIVPNSHFVDRQVVNWSYRDPKCRLHVPISVAYDTDPLIVTEALLNVARQEPKVLSVPSPQVWFKRFGDNALEFELLVWIDYPPDKEPIQSSLNFRIELELRKRSIQVPFPQLELWMRSNPQLLAIAEDVQTPTSLSETKTPLETVVGGNGHVSKTPNNWSLRELLLRITYFEACTDLELRKLIEYGYRQVYSSGQVVCQENEPGDSFYIILSGSVEVLSQRLEQYIATLHQGEFFGEISLLMGLSRTATVRTLEPSILFVVEHQDLQQLLREQPSLADQIAQKLSERQRELEQLGVWISENEEIAPFVWIRNRLQTLFDLKY